MNQASQINYTVSLILSPPKEHAYSTFNHMDIWLTEINTLNIGHFIPSDNDYKYIKDAMKSLIEDMIYDYAEYAQIKLPPRRFRMPVVSPIPPHSPPSIYTLATSDFT